MQFYQIFIHNCKYNRKSFKKTRISYRRVINYSFYFKKIINLFIQIIFNKALLISIYKNK